MPLAELLGQDLARRRLQHLARSDRVPASLLFTGPPGVGKALAARAFVQLLNCRTPSQDDACGTCPSCIQIARDRYPDLLRVVPDGAQIKLEQVRAIREFIGFAPMVGDWRTVIIDQAHRLNQAAANALLKTLEEPPAGVLFILLSHRHNLLPETVLSRCLLLPFAFLAGDAVCEILKRRAAATGAGHNDEALATAAAWSGGSLERADFFLDPDNLAWGRELVEKFAGLPRMGLSQALDLAAEAAGGDYREMLFYLLQRFLHEALLASALPGGGGRAGAFCRVWPAEIRLFAGFGPGRLRLWQSRLREIEDELNFNINLQLALEAFFLEIATAGRDANAAGRQ